MTDWRGIAAVVLASGVVAVLLIGSIGASLNRGRLVSTEEILSVATVLGAAVGAVAAYMGLRTGPGQAAGARVVTRSNPQKGPPAMPKQLVYIAVEAYVPPARPGFPGAPDQGLPPGDPGYPDQGLPPGYPGRPGQGLPRPPRPTDPDWGVDEGGYPDQGLPPGEARPPRPVYPIIEDHELGGHPEAELLDLNMTRRITITDGQDQFTAYALEAEPPQVEEGYEPRHPTKGLPGTWVAVLYGSALVWAWVRTPGAPGEPGQGLPGDPERQPKSYG